DPGDDRRRSPPTHHRLHEITSRPPSDDAPKPRRDVTRRSAMTTVDQTAPRAKRTIPGFAQLQRVGRSLMLPIASLPAAALLLRLGQPDMLGADGLGKSADWLVPVAAVLAA